MYLDTDKKFIMAEDENGNEICICEAVYVEKTITDILSRKQKISLRLYNKHYNMFHSVEIEREKLGKSIIKELCSFGISISAEVAENVEHFVDFLFSTEQEAEHVFSHSRLGFAEVNGTKCFLAHNPIGLVPEGQFDSWTEKPPDVASEWCRAMQNSEYSCPEKTKPRGTFKAWRRTIKREVRGRPKLELALALAALAPVAHILREAGPIVDIPMIALVGISSIGKTTAFRIIASVYGLATVGSGLITIMNSTINGLYAQLAANYGYPALFDEVTGAVGMDLSNIIYYMPNGQDKVRCNNDGSLKAPIKFSGAIFFSSEKSLFDNTIKTAGLHARLVEFSFVWTASRQNAENLEKELNANCGTAVYPLMAWLLKHEAWVIEKYEQEYDVLRKGYAKRNSTASNVANRVLKIYAQIMVAAQAVSSSLNLPLMIPEMRKLLLKNLEINPVAEVNPEEDYEAIKGFVLSNLAKFPQEKTHPALLSSVWGFTKLSFGKNEVWIEKSILEQQIAKVSTRAVKTVIKDFVANGWLFQDSSRHRIFKKKFAGVSAQFYRLRLEEPARLMVPKSKNKKRPTVKRRSLSA